MCKRTMVGTDTVNELDRHSGASSAMATASARPLRTRTTARLSETNCSGSYVALRSRTRPMAKTYRLRRWSSDHFAVATASRIEGAVAESPYAVRKRNSQYSGDGSGR